MADKDELGRAGEAQAASYLAYAGFEIIDRNWRCPGGEIDIVAVEGSELVVVEVKTRRSEAFGHPFEAVDARKRTRLWQLARRWVAAHPDASARRRVRIDLVGITGADPATARLEHLRDLR